MDKDNSDSEAFLLLQPELLTERQLRDILISRCVSRNLGTYSKTELVELFRKVALPLPQREYTGTSWREKKWRKKQLKAKRTISISHNDSSSSKSESDRKVPRLSNESSSSSSNTRLKPPPDMINYDKKVIKISDSSKSKNKSSLDTILIQSKSKESLSEISKTSEDKKANGKQVSPSNTEKSSSVIKLKRDSSSSKDDKNEANKDDSRKKRQKIVISW